MSAQPPIESAPYPPPPLVAGVYFLYLDGEIVYIGASSDIVFRITTHRRLGRKPFDSWTYEPAPVEAERYAREAELILLLRPRYNTLGLRIPYRISAERLCNQLLRGWGRKRAAKLLKQSGITPDADGRLTRDEIASLAALAQSGVKV